MLDYLKIKGKKKNNNNYYSLAPRDDIDEKNVYTDALNEAINKDGIFNIAITGQYGTGKSSIINTFKKKKPKNKYLNISLASFGDDYIKIDEKANKSTLINNNEDIDKNTHLSNLIEKSVLQQIIYKVDGKKIPGSRFKRIINISKIKLFILMILTLIVSVFLTILINPDFITKISDNILILEDKLENDIISSNTLLILMFLLILLYISWTMYKLIFFIVNNIKIKKLGNIELDNGESSYFNKYLDEIIYFFECNKYNVVILEDIDRFNNLMIFTKLRELNLLINNSENVKQKVKFIYALKDDMFKNDNEKVNRTKFFDIIIPVIQIVTSINSANELINMFKSKNNVKSPSEKIIKELTLYIWDMRMLYNIYNEYNLFSKVLLNDSLEADKLFSMIIYKNLYPSDFANLQIDQGELYKILKNKDQYIENLSKKFNDEFTKIEKQITFVNNNRVSNINDIIAIYISRLYQHIKGNFNNFYINEIAINSNGLMAYFNEQNFNNIKRIRWHNGSWVELYDDFINGFDLNLEYYGLKEKINTENENILNELKEKLQILKSQSLQLKKAPISELISLNEIKIDVSIDNKDFLVYLIKSGYIDETYNDYITYFKEGDTTRNDLVFVLHVKNNNMLDYDFNLKNCLEIFNRLKYNDYNNHAVLNIKYLDYLIQKNHNDEINYIIDLLLDEKDESLQFIDKYVCRDLIENKLISTFINKLTIKWYYMWNYIDREYNDDRKEKYCVLLLKYCDNKNIEKLNLNNCFSTYISNKSNLLSLLDDIDIEKVKDLIQTLSIKFVNLKFNKLNIDLFDYIYDNNHYDINIYMVKLILLQKNKLNENELDKANMTTLLKTDCHNLIEYISENIDIYVNNVLLKLKNNTEESQDTLISLYNNEIIEESLKIKLIKKMNTKIDNIETIDVGIWRYLFEENNVKVRWHNIFTYYNSIEELDLYLNEFINKQDNYNILSIEKYDFDEFEYEVYRDFVDKFVINEDINENALCKLLNVFPDHLKQYDTFNFNEVSIKRADELLDNKLLNFTSSNFNNLRSKYNTTLHIKFLNTSNQYIEYLIENIKDFDIDEKDLGHILIIDNITPDNKIRILEKALESKINESDMINVLSFKLSDFLLFKFLKLLTKNSCKVYLAVTQFRYHEKDKVVKILNLLGKDYIKLFNYGSKPTIIKNNYNKLLLDKLTKIKFISSYKEDSYNSQYYRVQTKTENKVMV